MICADDLARQVVAPGTPALTEIIQHFGSQYRTPEGTLDRQQMGKMVFSDPLARRALEAILHPRIREAFQTKLRSTRMANQDGVVVYDAPLLLEVGADREVTRVVVVHVSRDVQLHRVMTRDGLSETEAACRIDAQMDPEVRLSRADDVIDGTLPIEDIRRQLVQIISALDNTERELKQS